MLPYIVEFLGTFLLISIVIATGQPILIALALLLAILLGGSISGGHFNPATSLMFWAKGGLTNIDLAAYMGSQFAAGLVALGFFNLLYR